ncbi:hypothetical protein U1Q18_007207 [Sarracenia purpurea var. burkii]
MKTGDFLCSIILDPKSAKKEGLGAASSLESPLSSPVRRSPGGDEGGHFGEAVSKPEQVMKSRIVKKKFQSKVAIFNLRSLYKLTQGGNYN